MVLVRAQTPGTEAYITIKNRSHLFSERSFRKFNRYGVSGGYLSDWLRHLSLNEKTDPTLRKEFERDAGKRS